MVIPIHFVVLFSEKLQKINEITKKNKLKNKIISTIVL